MSDTIVYIASDHRGFGLKAQLLGWLRKKGYAPQDLGPCNEDRCDAQDFAIKLVRAMKADESSRGVLICGTGQAMTMTANRFQHVRAALCSNAGVARLAREHNDANVLVFGAGGIDVGEAETCLDVFLTTSFLEGRYAERRQRLSDLGGL